MTPVKPDTHCGRLLAVLGDGRWHTTSALHRRAGNMIVHSRIADLRRKGYRIEHDTVPGRKGAQAHRYIWLDAPAQEPAEEIQPLFSWDDLAPRRPAERFRIYRKRAGADLELVATTATVEGIGTTLFTLGEEGEWERANVGVLDTHAGTGTLRSKGSWIVSPFETGIY